jgi:ABC-type phosphate transport system ATPase subunit
LGNQLLFLNHGEVIEMGKTESVFNQPARVETAAFLKGEMIF